MELEGRDLWLMLGFFTFCLCGGPPRHAATGGMLVFVFLAPLVAAVAIEVVLVAGLVLAVGPGGCPPLVLDSWHFYILKGFHLVHSSDPQVPTFSWSNGCSVSVCFLSVVLSSCLPQGWLAGLRVFRLLSRNGLRFSLSTTIFLSICFSQQVSKAFCFTILHLTTFLLPVCCCCSNSYCHHLLAKGLLCQIVI